MENTTINDERCPMCNNKLRMMHEGLGCKNYKCELYYKLGKGWILRREFMTNNEYIIKKTFSKNQKLALAYRWNKFKLSILSRDDYTCVNCKYSFAEDYYRKKNLHVHHIIPVSENSSLYLDEENCLTLCSKCHEIIHLADKYNFSSLGDR